jgi:hypothetical protein
MDLKIVSRKIHSYSSNKVNPSTSDWASFSIRIATEWYLSSIIILLGIAFALPSSTLISPSITKSLIPASSKTDRTQDIRTKLFDLKSSINLNFNPTFQRVLGQEYFYSDTLAKYYMLGY